MQIKIMQLLLSIVVVAPIMINSSEDRSTNSAITDIKKQQQETRLRTFLSQQTLALKKRHRQPRTPKQLKDLRAILYDELWNLIDASGSAFNSFSQDELHQILFNHIMLLTHQSQPTMPKLTPLPPTLPQRPATFPIRNPISLIELLPQDDDVIEDPLPPRPDNHSNPLRPGEHPRPSKRNKAIFTADQFDATIDPRINCALSAPTPPTMYQGAHPKRPHSKYSKNPLAGPNYSSDDDE